MKKLTLVTGGARSGKSSFALGLADGACPRRAFIATAEALDVEMRARIERHKKERGPEWETHEIPLELAGWLEGNEDKYDLVVIDCLTLWLTNLMMKDMDVKVEFERLVRALEGASCSVVVVTNEVGMGIVPEVQLGRSFRDHSGRLNQELAEISDEAYMVVAGIPLKLK